MAVARVHVGSWQAAITGSFPMNTWVDFDLKIECGATEKWGRGIGLALVSAARAHLLGTGFRSAFLWVLTGNVRAERFYRMDQWAPDGEVRTDWSRGITVNELRYQRQL